MKKVFGLIALSALAALAQQEQAEPQQQYQPPPQPQYQQPVPQPQYQQPVQQPQYQQPVQQQPPQAANPEQRAKVTALIKKGVIKNKEEIQQESAILSYEDKRLLFRQNRKKHAWAWAGIDFGIGLGIGSLIQGDVAGGATQFIMDATGYAMLITGLALYEEKEEVYVPGIILLGASRIMGLVIPFVHQSNYNNNLKRALKYDNYAYSIDPLIIPRDGTPAVGLAFNLRY
jgi:hypothetical protein